MRVLAGTPIMIPDCLPTSPNQSQQQQGLGPDVGSRPLMCPSEAHKALWLVSLPPCALARTGAPSPERQRIFFFLR